MTLPGMAYALMCLVLPTAAVLFVLLMLGIATAGKEKQA